MTPKTLLVISIENWHSQKCLLRSFCIYNISRSTRNSVQWISVLKSNELLCNRCWSVLHVAIISDSWMNLYYSYLIVGKRSNLFDFWKCLIIFVICTVLLITNFVIEIFHSWDVSMESYDTRLHTCRSEQMTSTCVGHISRFHGNILSLFKSNCGCVSIYEELYGDCR